MSFTDAAFAVLAFVSSFGLILFVLLDESSVLFSLWSKIVSFEFSQQLEVFTSLELEAFGLGNSLLGRRSIGRWARDGIRTRAGWLAPLPSRLVLFGAVVNRLGLVSGSAMLLLFVHYGASASWCVEFRAGRKSIFCGGMSNGSVRLQGWEVRLKLSQRKTSSLLYIDSDGEVCLRNNSVVGSIPFRFCASRHGFDGPLHCSILNKPSSLLLLDEVR